MKEIVPSSEDQKNNPLHGVSLAKIMDFLIDEYGFEELSMLVRVNCFATNPSLQSSLKFLRKTPWAREQIEGLYCRTMRENNR